MWHFGMHDLIKVISWDDSPSLLNCDKVIWCVLSDSVKLGRQAQFKQMLIKLTSLIVSGAARLMTVLHVQPVELSSKLSRVKARVH